MSRTSRDLAYTPRKTSVGSSDAPPSCAMSTSVASRSRRRPPKRWRRQRAHPETAGRSVIALPSRTAPGMTQEPRPSAPPEPAFEQQDSDHDRTDQRELAHAATLDR